MACILIAEDMPDIREILQHSLEREGFVVVAAANGAEALRLERAAPVDLAIVDVLMPEIGGLEVVQHWRAAGRTMPVIVLTAYTTSGEADRGRAAGADAFIIKPFHMRDVVQTVRALLGASA